MTSRRELTEIVAEVRAFPARAAKFYVITRNLKPGLSPRSRTTDKYNYGFHEVRLGSELQRDLKDIFATQTEKHLTNENLEVEEYQPIADDEKKLITYSLRTRALPFAQFAQEQLQQATSSSRIHSLEGLSENIWAYAIVMRQSGGHPVYAFTKMAKTKVTIDSNQGGLKNLIAHFSTNGAVLEKFSGTTMTIDTKIDCILYQDKFYVFSKAGFEQIAGLEEEFQAAAGEALSTLEESEFVEGLEQLQSAIESSPSLARRIAKIKDDGALNLTAAQVKRMKAIAQDNRYALKVKGNKIILEDKDDVDLFVKLLNDYFLESRLTGKRYGSFSKKTLGE